MFNWSSKLSGDLLGASCDAKRHMPSVFPEIGGSPAVNVHFTPFMHSSAVDSPWCSVLGDVGGPALWRIPECLRLGSQSPQVEEACHPTTWRVGHCASDVSFIVEPPLSDLPMTTPSCWAPLKEEALSRSVWWPDLRKWRNLLRKHLDCLRLLVWHVFTKMDDINHEPN